MTNLIKMDLYRLFRTKSFKIGLIISLVIAFSYVAILATISKMVPMFSAETQEAMTIFPFANWRNGVNLFELILSAVTILSLMVSAVLASNFISDEQTHGYIKNIAGQIKDKGMMNVSKFVALAVMSASVLLAYTFGAASAGFIFLKSALSYEGFYQFLAVIGTKYLIYLSVNTIILFLCALTKSKSVSIAFGVMFGTGASIIVYNLISTFIGLVFKCDVPIDSYIPDGLVFGITMGATTKTLIDAVIVGAVYIAVFMVLSMMIMRRRDTR